MHSYVGGNSLILLFIMTLNVYIYVCMCASSLAFNLQVNLKKKLNKEERLALVRAGREDRGKYQARAAVKQKKVISAPFIIPYFWNIV